MFKVVLQKALREAGVASRRQSERLILLGKVAVNGKIINKLGTRVDPKNDKIALNGRTIRPKKLVYFLLNKPAGIVATVLDPQGRKTVIDLLKTKERLVPVGRLDINTSGLLLLTNDGDLTYRLTHPKFLNDKEYEITVQVPKDWRQIYLQKQLQKLEAGVVIANKFKTSRASARIIKRLGASHEYLISLIVHEGRKHQIRQMINAIGVSVVALRRVRLGPIRLGNLPPGKYRELTDEELDFLKS